MEKFILAEIQDIRAILARLLGTPDLQPNDQFSTEELDKAARLFLKYRTERGEWVAEQDLDKYLKKAPWRAGKFIREHFSFNDWYKHGHSYFYNKKSIQRLADELIKRNVDLKRYMEYVESQAAFEKKMEEYRLKKKGKYAYMIPADLAHIQTSGAPKPDVNVIKDDLKALKKEFFDYEMEKYVDIYKGCYAMMKYDYQLDRYWDSSLKAICKKWCDNFNYASNAIQLLTKKKEKFIPVKDDDMIEL
jgi:hypothetical protein